MAGAEDRETAVSLAGVTKTYEMGGTVYALRDLSLVVPRGSYTAVMGPSGSGKSTLLNLVGCLDTPTEGGLTVDGADVVAMSDRERTRLRGNEIGFVFQTFNLMPKLTAAENVALPMVFRGVDRAERSARARELLTEVGLGERADHRPNELSGGQRQRVAIARALANDPTLLLADEPTGNLDTETGSEIMALFERLNQRGNSILVVTHERPIAEHAERVVHLLDGELERVETVADRRIPDTDAALATGPEDDGTADVDSEGPAGTGES